jgi:hypothetical protein
MKLFKFLVDPPPEPFYEDSTKVPSQPVRFSEIEEDQECTFDLAELMSQVGTMKQPIKVPVKTKAEVIAAAHWTDKEQAVNDRKLKRDVHIDALNPSYMYPELGAPCSNRYLNHAKPPLGKWLNTKNNDIEDGFVPSANHVYTQEELVALAKEAPTEKCQPCPWKVILQEARSMRSNIHMNAGTMGNVMEMEGKYTDQEYIYLACLVDPGRELKFKTDQKMAPKMILVVIDSLALPARRDLDDYKDRTSTTYPRLKRKAGTQMIIFKSWLKNYLDYLTLGFMKVS